MTVLDDEALAGLLDEGGSLVLDQEPDVAAVVPGRARAGSGPSPGALEVGQAYEAGLEVRNKAGQLTTPATAVLTVTLPDGTVQAPAITLPPAAEGELLCDFVLTQAGLHKFSWLTTGPNTAKTDYVTCRNFISLISMQEAKDHLNITTANYDEELSRFMQAATELVQSKGGHTIRQSFTDEISDDIAFQLVLPRMPVLSVTSVTSVWPGGPSWDTTQLRVSPSGIVTQVQPVPFWWGPWTCVYQVGRAVPLETHLQAVKEQLRHLWETQRGSMPAPLLGGEEEFTTATGWQFSVPRRVLELLADEMLPSL
jgi:hypothetical protein